MAHMIEIKDNSAGLLTVTLPMILNDIGEKGANFNWSFLYLSATGNLGENLSMVDFEKSILDSPSGFCLDWWKLNDISHKFDQVFDALIVASINKESIRKYADEDELYLNYVVVLDLFDGAYWRVYAADESIIESLSAKFSDIKLSR